MADKCVICDEAAMTFYSLCETCLEESVDCGIYPCDLCSAYTLSECAARIESYKCEWKVKI